jgi:hypothetical protein
MLIRLIKHVVRASLLGFDPLHFVLAVVVPIHQHFPHACSKMKFESNQNLVFPWPARYLDWEFQNHHRFFQKLDNVSYAPFKAEVMNLLTVKTLVQPNNFQQDVSACQSMVDDQYEEI